MPDKFQMVLDMEEGTLAFLVEGHYLGIAHSGLRGKKLHVIVRWGWGHITIRHPMVSVLSGSSNPLSHMQKPTNPDPDSNEKADF